jgi:hypothetical protein
VWTVDNPGHCSGDVAIHHVRQLLKSVAQVVNRLGSDLQYNRPNMRVLNIIDLVVATLDAKRVVCTLDVRDIRDSGMGYGLTDVALKLAYSFRMQFWSQLQF